MERRDGDKFQLEHIAFVAEGEWKKPKIMPPNAPPNTVGDATEEGQHEKSQGVHVA